MSSFDFGKYEAHAAKMMTRHQIPGAAVGVSVDGRTVYKNAFGWRDVERQLPIDDQTVFGIASVTKQVTAVAIMQLQEQGKLSVADPVIKYLPEFKFGKDGAEKGMTIHHFLTHTSGIPPLFSLTRTLVRSFWEDESMMEGEQGEKLKQVEPIDTPMQLMEYMASLDVDLLGNPGEYFSYSNDCYGLLGEIIARVSGMSYEEYVTGHILKPLGMVRSTFSKAVVDQMDNVATLYTSKRVKNKTVVFPAPVLWQAPAMTACGFMKSTLHDMMRYMEIYRTGGKGPDGVPILSRKSIDQICAPYAVLPTGGHYGYGVMVHSNYHGVSLVEHGGNLKGVASWITCAREKGITGVALTTLTTAPSQELLLGAMNVVMGLPVRTTRQVFKPFICSAERLAQYAGVYRSQEQSTEIRVTTVPGGLDIEGDGVHYYARPVGVDTFVIKRKGVNSAVKFLRDESGDPWGLFLGFRIVTRSKSEE